MMVVNMNSPQELKEFHLSLRNFGNRIPSEVELLTTLIVGCVKGKQSPCNEHEPSVKNILILSGTKWCFWVKKKIDKIKTVFKKNDKQTNKNKQTLHC